MPARKEKSISFPKDEVERSKIVAQLAVGAAILMQNGATKRHAFSAILECYADLNMFIINEDAVKDVKDL